MDISVLASVGSFVVSERVLKPKASVLVVLGCVLAYDLTTKTHDSSSLRVYRGPGLLAVSLMMVAYSLRTWRRNGIACDELLFLPGTPHGDSTTTTTAVAGDGSLSGGGGGQQQQQLGHQYHPHQSNSISSSNHSSPTHHHHHHHHHGNTTTATTATTLLIMPAIQQQQQLLLLRSEGDVAAGGSWVNTTTTNNSYSNNNSSSHSYRLHHQQQQTVGGAASSSNAAEATVASSVSLFVVPPQPQRSFSQRSRARSLSHDSSLSSIHEFVNTWEDDNSIVNDTNNNNNDNDGDQLFGTTNNNHHHHHLRANDTNDNDNDDANLMIPLTRSSSSSADAADTGRTLQQQQQQQHGNNNNNNSSSTTSPSNNSMMMLQQQQSHGGSTSPTTDASSNNHTNHTRAERFRDNHPNVTRLGSFFFFRPSTSSTHNAAYAPSGPSVVGAAIDLSMPVLFNFHLFIEAWNHMDSTMAKTAATTENNDGGGGGGGDADDDRSTVTGGGGGEASAKILPLIFLSVLIVRSFFPPGRRGRFWSTIKITACAPFHRSRFRDGYIGDVLTSLVRPFQDVVFALAYYVTVIWGSVTSKYNLSESGQILERSWILHNVVLPTIALLPLWWKFLQTLRKSYDTGKRWPYLGNAFKYLTASIVILYGMTHPEDRRSTWWIVAFGITLLYQIFWDTVMDWDLFVIAPKETYCDSNSSLDISESTMWFNRPISSMRPDSYWLLSLQRHVVPIRECIRSWLVRFPSYKQIQIRPRRLYKSELFYWRIFLYNTIFRFCWMLSFIPAYHFSSSGRDVITTFSSDTNSYVGVLLPIAEILRRTLWGFLYLEIQTIKITDGGEPCHQQQLYSNINNCNGNPNDPNNGSENDATTIEMSSLLQDSSKHGPSKFQQHHYLPAWLGMQQQLQHDAAMTTTTTLSSSTVVPNAWFQYSDLTRRKLFMIELSIWAMAFLGLGVWATMS